MADPSVPRDAPAPARRISFRRSITEAPLPDEFLEALEQKRRQLDESIHKYIAAKEREYKHFEKDIRHQFKSAQDRTQSAATAAREQQQRDADDARVVSPGESALDDEAGADMSQSQRAAAAGLTDRRASLDRDKDFLDVFVPSFLPALGIKSPAATDAARASSEPPTESAHGAAEAPAARPSAALAKAHSDPNLLVVTQRPPHLHTSSSGSSADGKLASAMKSPISIPRTGRKRVSLALGDTIVAPSDSVPKGLSHNSTPSHSRTRPSTSESLAEDELLAAASRSSPNNTEAPAVSAEESGIAPALLEHSRASAPATGKNNEAVAATDFAQPPAFSPRPQKSATPRATPTIDPDGDLFDLEDLDYDESADRVEAMSDIDDDDDAVVTGRVAPHGRSSGPSDESALDASPPGHPTASDTQTDEFSDDESALYIDSASLSASASQHPTSPGFRRPSANMDPIYSGADYPRAELHAVVNEVYGSSYARPATKGSFTAGSLGESYMARNAEVLMRNRASVGPPK